MLILLFVIHLIILVKISEIIVINKNVSPESRIVAKRLPALISTSIGTPSGRYISIDDAVDIAKNDAYKSFIGMAHWDTSEDHILELLKYCPVVLHDSEELVEDIIKYATKWGSKIGVVRKPLTRLLRRGYGVDSTYLPHPYIPHDFHNIIRDTNAVSLSRIEWDKHSDIMLEANLQLSADKIIKLYGRYSRMYDYYKLSKIKEDWKDIWWGGEFESEFGGAVEIAATANYLVDMTLYENDGGGTQYTTLEAFNAGTVVVVHDTWLSVPGEICTENAIAVDGVNGLVELLNNPMSDDCDELIQNGYKVMNNHSPDKIVPIYEHFLGV